MRLGGGLKFVHHTRGSDQLYSESRDWVYPQRRIRLSHIKLGKCLMSAAELVMTSGRETTFLEIPENSVCIPIHFWRLCLKWDVDSNHVSRTERFQSYTKIVCLSRETMGLATCPIVCNVCQNSTWFYDILRTWPCIRTQTSGIICLLLVTSQSSHRHTVKYSHICSVVRFYIFHHRIYLGLSKNGLPLIISNHYIPHSMPIKSR